MAPCDSVDASLRRARLAAPLAVARKLQSSGHGAGTQPFVPGAMRFIHRASEQFKTEPVAGYASLSEQLDDDVSRLLASASLPLDSSSAQKPAAAARTNGLVAARIGPSEGYSDESQTAARGPGRVASTSHETH